MRARHHDKSKRQKGKKRTTEHSHWMLCYMSLLFFLNFFFVYQRVSMEWRVFFFISTYIRFAYRDGKNDRMKTATFITRCTTKLKKEWKKRITIIITNNKSKNVCFGLEDMDFCVYVLFRRWVIAAEKSRFTISETVQKIDFFYFKRIFKSNLSIFKKNCYVWVFVPHVHALHILPTNAENKNKNNNKNNRLCVYWSTVFQVSITTRLDRCDYIANE